MPSCLLQQGGGDSGEHMGGFCFPPREQYRSATQPAMSRVSEDWGRSGTLSESICASIYGADRTTSSQLLGEDMTPAMSKHSSANTPAAADAPIESPFEALEFQVPPNAYLTLNSKP